MSFQRDAQRIARDAALDGIYVLRTSLTALRLDAAQTVRSYKRLAQVERAFRVLKSLELEIRPIHHRLAGRVRAHVLLCMLAYYVEWHMRRVLAPLLFDHDHPAAAEAARVRWWRRRDALRTRSARRLPSSPPMTLRYTASRVC